MRKSSIGIAVVAIVAWGATAAAASTVRSERRFRANTFTREFQGDAAVASNASGSFVVVWSSEADYGPDSQDGSNSGVFAQRFGPAGRPQGRELQVNDYTNRSQRDADVAVAPNGDFVVAWHGRGPSAYPNLPDAEDDPVYGLRLRRFASNGSPLGSAVQVTDEPIHSAQVESAADGSFVVLWMDYPEAGDRYVCPDLFVQRFASDGAMQGPTLQVNSHATAQPDYDARLAVGADGRFVVAWSQGTEPYNYGEDIAFRSRRVFAKRYASDGSAVGEEFAVSEATTGTQRQPAVRADADGGFLMAWLGSGANGSGGSTFARAFSAAGEPLAGDRPLSDSPRSHSIELAASGAGEFVATWVDGGRLDRDGECCVDRLMAARVDRSGARVESPLAVVRRWHDRSRSGHDVAGAANGRFAVVWSKTSSRWQSNVRGAVFAPADLPITTTSTTTTTTTSTTTTTTMDLATHEGPVLAVNRLTAGDQHSPALCGDATGGFVVVFRNDGVDGERAGLYARVFDAGGVSPRRERIVVRDRRRRSGAASVGCDPRGGFVVVWERAKEFRRQARALGRRFDRHGRPLGAAFRLSGAAAQNERAPRISFDGAGGFVVVYAIEARTDGAPTGVPASTYTRVGYRLFDANGRGRGGQRTVHDDAVNIGRAPDVTRLPDGGFVVAWEGLRWLEDLGFGFYTPTDLLARRFGADGDPIGPAFLLDPPLFDLGGSQTRPTVRASDDGGFAAVWVVDDRSVGEAVAMRRFASDGVAPSGRRILSHARIERDTTPSLAQSRDGAVVVWANEDRDPEVPTLELHRLDRDGDSLGSLGLSLLERRWQRRPASAALAGGGFVVAWEAENEDGEGGGVFAQRFSGAVLR